MSDPTPENAHPEGDAPPAGGSAPEDRSDPIELPDDGAGLPAHGSGDARASENDASAASTGGSTPAGSARGRGAADRQGVTIPGYQPVELLGATPSYGAWVRAIQVRMDRRVLLKVLKPGLPLAHEYFGREIQAVVRLDGDGVLRAIDEGTIRGFRYLVVDEAEGIALSTSVIAGEEGWCELTRTALELWRRVLERECVLLPLGVDAWRRLPAGDFAVADLGWLVPLGEESPEHPRLPAPLAGRPLRPHDAIATFEAAGNAFAAAFGIPLPAPWRRAVQSLATVSDDAQFEDVARALAEARTAVDPPRTKQWLFGVVAALLVVAAVVGGTLAFLGGDDPDPEPPPNPIANGGEVDPEPVDPVDPPPPTEEERAALAAAERESAAWEAFLAVLPDIPESVEGVSSPEGDVRAELAATDPLAPFPLAAERVAELRSVIERFGGTEVEGHAALALAHHGWALERDLRRRLEATLEIVDLELSLGRVAQAESAWLALEEELDAAGREVPASLRIASASLGSWIAEAGKVQVAALRERIDAARAARTYRSIAEEVGKAVPLLPIAEQGWGEEQRLELLATAERFERVRTTVSARVRASGDAASTADFAAAVSKIAAVEGEDEFPEVAARRRRWAEALETAHRVADSISGSLASAERAERAHEYSFRESEEIRGRVVATDGTRVTIKLDGRRTELEYDWLDLSRAMWEELAGGTLPLPDRLLVEALLGNRESLEHAEALDPPPAWTVEVRRRVERAANAGFGRLLDRGREAHRGGRHAAAHAAAREIAATIPADLWTEERDELTAWCRAHWEAVGPGEAFPGANSVWKRDRSIVLAYDFGDAEAVRGWIAERPGQGTVKAVRGGMLVQGSVWLAPGGHADLFEERLSVSTEVVSAAADEPNVNVVLFARSGGDHGSGDLFALGFKPPSPHAARIDGDIPVFLPANLMGPVGAAERGRGRNLIFARSTPKVSRGRPLSIEVASTPDGLRFDWREGQLSEKGARPGPAERLGTVQFRSYRTELRVDRITVSGRISDSWWQRWVGERVARDLRAP